MACVACLFSALVLVGVMAALVLLVEPPGVIVAMAPSSWSGSCSGPGIECVTRNR
jgi:hypothetical protein